MYCTRCGKELKENARFCIACGAPIDAESPDFSKTASAAVEDDAVCDEGRMVEPKEASSVAVVASDAGAGQQGNKGSIRKGPSPVLIAVIALAALAVVACVAAVIFFSAQRDSGDEPTSGERTTTSQSQQSASTESATSESTAESVDEQAEEAAEEAEMTSGDEATGETNGAASGESAVADPYGLNGWWHTLGQSGSVFHHFVNDTDYVYQRDHNDETVFSFVDTNEIISVQHYEIGEIPVAKEEPCRVIALGASGQTYIQYDSDQRFMDCQRPDGSGYSGTSSLGRTDDVAGPLLALADSIEGNASTGGDSGSNDGGASGGNDDLQASIDAAVIAGKQILEGTIVVTTYANRAHEMSDNLHDFDGRNEPFILLMLDEPSSITCLNHGGSDPTYTREITNFCLNKGNIQQLSRLDGQHAVIAVDVDPYPSDRYWYSDTTGVLANCTGVFQLISPEADASVAAADADFILPDSSSRVYSRAELESMDTYSLFLARNELFARHGCGFRKQELRDRFGSMAWYNEVIPAGTYGTEVLTDIEKANAETMLAIEQERSSPYLH